MAKNKHIKRKVTRRKFALKTKESVDCFCPGCGKILWEELGQGKHFYCQRCKQEISTSRYKTVSKQEIILMKDYDE